MDNKLSIREFLFHCCITKSLTPEHWKFYITLVWWDLTTWQFGISWDWHELEIAVGPIGLWIGYSYWMDAGGDE